MAQPVFMPSLRPSLAAPLLEGWKLADAPKAWWVYYVHGRIVAGYQIRGGRYYVLTDCGWEGPKAPPWKPAECGCQGKGDCGCGAACRCARCQAK